MSNLPDSPQAPEDLIKKEFKRGKKEIGFERVRLALERLQLAWLRTAITFVALGFTAYRYYLSRVEDGKEQLLSYLNGNGIGKFLIFVGLLGLLQATLQHRRNCAKLKIYYPSMPYSISMIQSYFVLAFTLALFVSVIFEL